MIQTWNDFIEEEKNKQYFKDLEVFLNEQYLNKCIYPERKNIFKAYDLTPLNTVKCVILGQDPYHGENQAHGLSFSVLCKKLPPSLMNIYKEMNSDLNIEISKTGDLTSWAEQGVFLLNTVLTVEKSKPYSHKNKGWETFTRNTILLLNTINRPIVFILWGNHARKFKSILNNANHLIIESAHPSPLSSYQGFFGSKPFSKVNEYLLLNNQIAIDWKINNV